MAPLRAICSNEKIQTRALSQPLTETVFLAVMEVFRDLSSVSFNQGFLSAPSLN